MRRIRYIALAAVAFAIAACGDHSSSITAPEAVPTLRRDGGLGVGGSATGGGSGGTTTSTTSTNSAQTDSTSRDGGLGVGGS